MKTGFRTAPAGIRRTQPNRMGRIGLTRCSQFAHVLTLLALLSVVLPLDCLAQVDTEYPGVSADQNGQNATPQDYPQGADYGQGTGYLQATPYGQGVSSGDATGYGQTPGYTSTDPYGNDTTAGQSGNGRGSVQSGSDAQGTQGAGRAPFDVNGSDQVTQYGRRLQQQQSAGALNRMREGGRQPLTQFQRVIVETTGDLVPVFGAAMFREPPSTFAPVQNIPVTPDYVVGPGDEIRLQVWGQVNLRGTYPVDRTGAISVPQVGAVHVAGLHYSELSDFLKSQLSRVYRNFDLNVNLGQLRSIQVFVVGKVVQPGSYTISSLSTLLNALFVSGGPLPLGSLRDVQLRRGGKTVVHFDLYDLVLHGDKSKDVPLEPGDVIFVPDVGKQVAVLGSVKMPAVYELRDETTYQQVVALAGGETNVAADTGARVERVYHHAERKVIDIDLKNPTSPPAEDGDVVIINSILERFRDSVTLRGNVANPGRYAWHPGMRISDLIPNQESLVTREYYRRHDRLGQANLDYLGPVQQEGGLGLQASTPEQFAPSPSPYQSNALNSQLGTVGPGTRAGSTIPPLQNQVGQRSETGTGGASNSAGSALTQGNSSFSPKTDVVLSAPDIDWNYAVIERQNAKTLTTSLLSFDLGKVLLDKDESQNLELLSGDVVTIFSKADIRVPNSQQTKFVKLEGEFVSAGVYSVQPGETLRQLLQRAGGFTPEAYLYGSEFTRVSVRRLQRQRLTEYADSLESSISLQTSGAISAAVTDRDAAAAQASAEQARTELARLRQVQPTGRIVLQLKPDSNGINAIPDIVLEDGDRFVVPRVPTTVNVVGQVYSPNAFLFESRGKVRDYLQMAGGPERMADRSREFILRADGSVVSRQYASNRHIGDFNHLGMLPGDTIVVPPKVQKGNILRDVANIATIAGGLGLAAAAIQVLP
jgi:polysaccharide export outer membrane protein